MCSSARSNKGNHVVWTSSAMSHCFRLTVLALLANVPSAVLLGGGGTMGPVCTHLGRRCLSVARCLFSQQRCQCPDHLPVGDGLLECAEPGHMTCSVDCDPKVNAWGGSRAPVNLPCWYRVTRFLRPIVPQPQASLFKWCHVHVQALNILTEAGLFFVGAVSVDVHVAGLDANDSYVLHVKSLLKLQVNVHSARQSIRTRKSPWTVEARDVAFWDREDVRAALGGVLVVFTDWDAVDRIAVLKIPQCRVCIKYRPFGPLQPQMLKPGLVVTVPSRNDTHFKGPYFSSLCMTRPNVSITFPREATRWKLKNPAQVALFYSLLQSKLVSAPVNNPDFYRQCRNVRNQLQYPHCILGRYLAVGLCGPLLNRRRRFVTCLGRELVMGVFERCVAWACSGTVEDCQWFIDTLHRLGCRPTRLMERIACRLGRRKHYVDHVFNPSPLFDDFARGLEA